MIGRRKGPIGQAVVRRFVMRVGQECCMQHRGEGPARRPDGWIGAIGPYGCGRCSLPGVMQAGECGVKGAHACGNVAPQGLGSSA